MCLLFCIHAVVSSARPVATSSLDPVSNWGIDMSQQKPALPCLTYWKLGTTHCCIHILKPTTGFCHQILSCHWIQGSTLLLPLGPLLFSPMPQHPLMHRVCMRYSSPHNSFFVILAYLCCYFIFFMEPPGNIAEYILFRMCGCCWGTLSAASSRQEVGPCLEGEWSYVIQFYISICLGQTVSFQLWGNVGW